MFKTRPASRCIACRLIVNGALLLDGVIIIDLSGERRSGEVAAARGVHLS
jgi:hypothetical protein